MPPEFLLQQMELREELEAAARRRTPPLSMRCGPSSAAQKAHAGDGRSREAIDAKKDYTGAAGLVRKLHVPRPARRGDRRRLRGDRDSGAAADLRAGACRRRRTSTGSRSASTWAPPTRWSPRCAAASPAVLPDAHGRPLLPSIVRYSRRRQASRSATPRRRSQADDPKNTIVSVKRFMGRGVKDVAHVESAPYDFVDAPGMVQIRTVAGVKSPVEVSAEILRVLRERAELSLQGNICGRGHHRAGVLRRRAAPGDQGRGQARRPERPAPAERADRGGDRLRPGERRRGHLRGLRPRRRHLRHLDPEAVEGRVRGRGDQRRLDARRRRLRPAPVLLGGRAGEAAAARRRATCACCR